MPVTLATLSFGRDVGLLAFVHCFHSDALIPSSCSGRFFTVKLPSALESGAKVTVIVETVYTHVLQPYPTQITQSEKQFVVFEGNHYFYSPYPTKTQTTRVKLASRNVESYTKLGNPTRSEDVLDYGPFRDVAPYSEVGSKHPACPWRIGEDACWGDGWSRTYKGSRAGGNRKLFL